MTCKDCCNYPYCPYLCYFNHDKDVGCVEFIKAGDYRTTVVTNSIEDPTATPILAPILTPILDNTSQ